MARLSREEKRLVVLWWWAHPSFDPETKNFRDTERREVLNKTEPIRVCPFSTTKMRKREYKRKCVDFLQKEHTPCQDLRESKNREGRYIANENKWMSTHSHPPPKRTHNLGDSFIPHQTGAGGRGGETQRMRDRKKEKAYIHLITSLSIYRKTYVPWNPLEQQEQYKPHFL